MKKLLTIEKVAAGYAVLTSLVMAVFWAQLVEPWSMVQTRLLWLLMTGVLVGLGRLKGHPSAEPTGTPEKKRRRPRVPETERGRLWVQWAVTLLRVAGQLAWLRYWYPDIYEFNRLFPNLDHLFAATDQWLFGCQPSIVFSQWLSGDVWSELFNLGYWSYFPMIAIMVLTVFWKDARKLRETREIGSSSYDGEALQVGTVILISFLCFYLLYLLLPVAGPQFYFQAVGLDEIVAGHFPALGTYFSSHTEMLPAPGNPDGFFYQLVTQAQTAGERPVAAFPSSHIGISTIVLLLSRRHVPRLFWVLLPFWFLLCCATVYIQAHYLVDAIAGLIAAPLVLAFSIRIAQKFTEAQ